MAQRDDETKEIRAIKDKLTAERERVQEHVRQEFIEQIAEAKTQINLLQYELANDKAQAKAEVLRLEGELVASKKAAELELETLHQR